MGAGTGYNPCLFNYRNRQVAHKNMETYLHIALIVLSAALVGTILLQSHGGMGGAFGGDFGGPYQTRRGLQNTLFQITVGFAVLFFSLVLVNVFVLR